MRKLLGLLGLLAWVACVLVVRADAEDTEYAIIFSAGLGGVMIGIATVRAGCAWMVAGLLGVGLLTVTAMSHPAALSADAALWAVGMVALGGLCAGWLAARFAES
jgi:hypothetical protein